MRREREKTAAIVMMNRKVLELGEVYMDEEPSAPDTERQTCVICMEWLDKIDRTIDGENLKPSKKTRIGQTIPCHHLFHARCIKKWTGLLSCGAVVSGPGGGPESMPDLTTNNIIFLPWSKTFCPLCRTQVDQISVHNLYPHYRFYDEYNIFNVTRHSDKFRADMKTRLPAYFLPDPEEEQEEEMLLRDEENARAERDQEEALRNEERKAA